MNVTPVSDIFARLYERLNRTSSAVDHISDKIFSSLLREEHCISEKLFAVPLVVSVWVCRRDILVNSDVAWNSYH